MRTKRIILCWAIAVAGSVAPAMVLGQSAPAAGPTTGGASGAAPAAAPAMPVRMETRDELLAKLNAEQKQKFDEASKAFGAKQYADAATGFKELLVAVPGDSMLAKFASEASLNAGDAEFALKTLKPLSAANPDDWQMAALLTRACAESGDAACRDAGIAHMLDLRKRGLTPLGLREYVVERVKVGDKTLVIRTALEPYSGYHVYATGQIQDSDGKIAFHIALESGDFDQAPFAKEHPEEAAKGMRRFSLDGYQDTGVNSNGQKTQTHYTFKFLDGQPPYAQVREEFLEIAEGKTKAMSSRAGLIVP
jgi:hypothetical protein